MIAQLAGLILFAAPNVLTLEQALETAQARQPEILRARAERTAAEARRAAALAPLLPQLGANVGYQRTTANFAGRPGAIPGSTSVNINPSFTTYNFFNFGLSASMLLWDFGQTWSQREASTQLLEASLEGERAIRLQAALDVRIAYFEARAAQALVGVAAATLENQERHLEQVRGLVSAGTRPEIDLAQFRTDVANARVQHINAENGYATAKARLMQAMGLEGSADFEVADESMPAVLGEEQTLEELSREALATRPDVARLGLEMRAQAATLSGIRGAYWPRLSASTGFSEAGTALDAMVWNWDAGLALSWPFFEGGRTNAQVDEAAAQIASLEAQLTSVRLAVQVQLEQLRLAVIAAKEVVVAAEEARSGATEQLRLAEGRYGAGVGSVLELSDAQLRLTNAQAQVVQAEYSLASARAQLLWALGRLL